MTRSPAGSWILVLGFVLAGLAGCGAGGQTPPPETGVVPAGQSLETSGVEVEIFTSAERILVHGFRIDFPKLRNITELIGFAPEQWDRVVRIPLADLQEFQIRGIIDSATFGRIYANREQFSVEPEEFFNVTIVALDGTRSDLVAILPRFRGIRDGVVWELSMRGNPARIDRVIVRHSEQGRH
mgnify:CR=1 FL=1